MLSKTFKAPPNAVLHPLLPAFLARLSEPRRFLQALVGPRQVGKTTLVRQALQEIEGPTIYATADGPLLEDRLWIGQQWERARLGAKRETEEGPAGAVLVLDEIQKIKDWSEIVKRLWDEDTFSGMPLKVVLLGSSPLMMERGLGESLAGRFEVLRMTHWSFTQMRDAFDWDLDQYLLFGGYPGGASLIEDPTRWRRYLEDSLIEPLISRDILLRVRVDKPVLLRRLFQLGCEYSGQVLSYQKMLGELVDAGNTTTLAHYLELLSGAGVITGLEKIAEKPLKRRTSSPKLLALNTALLTAVAKREPHSILEDPIARGRQVETAIGAHLYNGAQGTDIGVYYWRDRGKEVDYVLEEHGRRIALEVKTGGRREPTPGIEEFDRRFGLHRKLLVGTGGIPIEEFLASPVSDWTKA